MNNAPNATIRKQQFISYVISPGLKRFGVNPRDPATFSFFHMPLQAWLRSNATADSVILHQQLPWKIYFPFLCWNLWLPEMNVFLRTNHNPNIA